ncbi:MAG: hypothetical protein J6Y20_01415 [Lachnospiraceae bacterium]|nr:hypothetical protein [Lachnospiraceae bacterium]
MGKNITSENDDRSYNLFRPMSDEDDPYGVPGEKVKAHLTGVLAGSELMRDVKIEISKIEFSGDGPTKDNLISTLLTRDKMDRILAPKTEENKEFFDKCRLQILCEITVSGADGRTFSEGQFAGIEDLWYVKWFRIRNGEEAGK